MLKDANPAETLDQARSTLNSQQRSSWMGGKSLLVYETLDGRGIMEAGFARKLS